MAKQASPQEIFYVLDVTTFERQEQKPLTKAKEACKRLLRRAFPRKGATVTTTGGSRQTRCSVSGGLDHSGIAALLSEVEELKDEELEDAEIYTRDNPRDPAFNYTLSITVDLWVGTADQFMPQDGDPARLRPQGAQHLRNQAITAENLTAVLNDFDTADARRAKANTIARAMAPVGNPKLMKPLKVKKPA